MCGITGVVGCGDPQLLERMTTSIAHRGPDDAGIEWFADARVGLGHRRLSIIDLSPGGHQPMASDDRKFWIVFNGEIYNYLAIRGELEKAGHHFRSASDTEVLLKAYIEWGPACLPKLNGMFAFAIYDVERKKLFAARDQLGIKPFYYWQSGNALVFASEIKALLNTGLVPCEPDYEALHTPARFQISPLTGFKNIFKLAPGECMTFENGKIELKTFWSISPVENNNITEGEALEQLEALVRDSVALQKVADVPVGVFLSGGLDSSIIAALVRAGTNHDMHSFTIKFTEDDHKFESMPRDDVYADMVAKHLGFQHHVFEINPNITDLLPKIVWHLDEPLADPAAINLYLMSKAARDQGLVVMLNGMGGDEIFGGYRKHLACLKAETYQAYVPRAARSAIEKAMQHVPVASGSGGFRALRWTKRFISIASQPRTERFLSSDLSFSPAQFSSLFADRRAYADTHFYRAQAPTLSGNGVSYLTKMCLNDTKVFLPEHNLTYTDKTCMAAAIEARPPLTDYRVVEFMYSMPPWTRIKGNTQKYLLKKISEKYLPHDVVYRPKAPFAAPLRSWIRGALAPMVDDLLSREAIQKRGLYDADFVTKLIANDRAGLEDNSYPIWTLLNVEVWFRTFFQN